MSLNPPDPRKGEGVCHKSGGHSFHKTMLQSTRSTRDYTETTAVFAAHRTQPHTTACTPRTDTHKLNLSLNPRSIKLQSWTHFAWIQWSVFTHCPPTILSVFLHQHAHCSAQFRGNHLPPGGPREYTGRCDLWAELCTDPLVAWTPWRVYREVRDLWVVPYAGFNPPELHSGLAQRLPLSGLRPGGGARLAAPPPTHPPTHQS